MSSVPRMLIPPTDSCSTPSVLQLARIDRLKSQFFTNVSHESDSLVLSHACHACN